MYDAVAGSSLATARMLLQAGADPNLRNRQGASPLHHAVVYDAGRDIRGQPGVAWIRLKILLKSGAQPNISTEDSATPLHLAAQYNDPLAARMLLDGEADLHARMKDGQTPLQVAKSHQAHAVVELLRPAGGWE